MATNPYINRVDIVRGNSTETLINITDTTAVASDVAQGKYFYLASGEKAAGTSSGGGGSSAWTKVAEKSYAVSTTSTTAATVETWETEHSELWTSDKIVYVRVRDTAGKRNGYFYGSDQFFYNVNPATGGTATSITTSIRVTTRYTSAGAFAPTSSTGTTGYGVWADTLYSDGSIKVRSRYNSSSSLTVNGTYKVEVYLLDPAGGVPIFG